MRSAIIFALGFVASVIASPTPSLTERAAPVNQLVGYASQNGGTVGGTGGTTTTVTTLAALRAAVTGTAKKIVKVSGIIKGDGKTVDVGSFTTVLGVGANSGLTGGGFRVKKLKVRIPIQAFEYSQITKIEILLSNVIFRNLKISLSPAPTDLIGLQVATNVWIDHCEFFNDLTHDKDFYDGATDITHASDFITVSWNKYHNTYKTSLIGHSDSNSAEDKGHLRVTYHHNSFTDIGSRTPSLRFGTGHFYNNVVRNALYSGVNSRLGAQMLVESNLFVNVPQAIETTLEGGFVVSKNNIFTNSTYDPIAVGTLNSMPYSYTLDAASSIDALIAANAGTGIVSA